MVKVTIKNLPSNNNLTSFHVAAGSTGLLWDYLLIVTVGTQAMAATDTATAIL
ncbi:hypothetical protein [Sporosarcina sp. G11-34]|uniref:hypothetical protein n=1 Tax=Sporosarcina sp. G11-34 TaxID=2849605 RepID=UPI003FA6EE7C|nr:hypothetical protein [Sporosarcina sp. G11-34]